MIEAKVIADSISTDGVRLTTVQATSNRFILAEANTHRTWSRNSASSRAIPLAKQIKRIMEELAYPSVFPAEQKGMQGGEALSEEEQRAARIVWEDASEDARDAAETLGRLGVHKSVANRLLEPFMWHTMCITATAWENFFLQRCHPDAQPEIRLMAEAIRDAMAESTPQKLDPGEWHLPYVGDDEETLDQLAGKVDAPAPWDLAAKVSAARCARTSYLTQEGKRDIQADLDLYARLVERESLADPRHWSPLEHVATPWPQNRQDDYRHGLNFDGLDGINRYVSTSHLPRVGNLLAWRSLRTEEETRLGAVTFR